MPVKSVIDWEQRQATCPLGRQSSRGTPVIDSRNNAVIKITCAQRDCQPCPSRLACTRAMRRTITVRPHAPYFSRQAVWQRKQTEADHVEYAERTGIEGTLSHAVRARGLRRARYIGAVKTIPSEYPAYVDCTIYRHCRRYRRHPGCGSGPGGPQPGGCPWQ
jgi:transposase